MGIVESIKSILSEQVTGYRVLLDVLRRERECLVQIDAAGVEELSKEKDTIVLKLKLLEEERIRLVRAFSADRRLAGAVALQKIAELTGDESLHGLRLQLLSLLQGIAEFNEFNKVLIERSSAIVRNSLSFLGSCGVSLQNRSSGSLLSREA